MMDALQARVRVSPSRLKKLKAIIAKCDRDIQTCNFEINRAILNIEMADEYGFTGHPWDRWRKLKSTYEEKRRRLDSVRLKARLEIKGYKINPS